VPQDGTFQRLSYLKVTYGIDSERVFYLSQEKD